MKVQIRKLLLISALVLAGHAGAQSINISPSGVRIGGDNAAQPAGKAQAPGQLKKEYGGSATDYAPGQPKKDGAPALTLGSDKGSPKGQSAEGKGNKHKK